MFGFRGGGGPSPLFNHFNLPFHPHHSHHHHPHAHRPTLPPPPLESPPQLKLPPVEDSCLAAALQGAGPALAAREGSEDGGTGHPLKMAATACDEENNENEAGGGAENGLNGVVCKGMSWLEF